MVKEDTGIATGHPHLIDMEEKGALVVRDKWQSFISTDDQKEKE